MPTKSASTKSKPAKVAKPAAKAKSPAKSPARGKAVEMNLPAPARKKVVSVVFEVDESAEPIRRNGPIKVEPAIPMRPAKPRSKGAPPPVIAKPKPKPKTKSPTDGDRPRKKIDYTTAVSVVTAATAAAKAQEADKQGYVIIGGRRIRVLSGVKAKENRRAARKAGKTILAPTGPGGVRLTRAQLRKQRVQEEVLARTQDGLADHVKNLKTKLSKKELAEAQALLLRRRTELVARVLGVQEDALRSDGGNLSNMPIHMADVGTDTFDQDFALGLAEADRVILFDIDEALERIQAKTYGVCLLTGKPIPKGRLLAKPWARYTIEAARRMEQIRAARPQ